VSGDKPEAAVWLSPGRRGGEPCVYGTRLPTEMIARAVWSAMPLERVCHTWNVPRAQVLGACWYEARYGRKRWARRWGEWADVNRSAMWCGDLDAVTAPPTRETRP
jgi:uncharacterized protein (DUF433 family)